MSFFNVSKAVGGVMEKNDMPLIIAREAPECETAIQLMRALSDVLETMTGSSGRQSFSVEDLRNPRSIFVIARTTDGVAVGCGAFRPFDASTAEIKRMYAKESGRGVGAAILQHLEVEAKKMGYVSVRLETRKINRGAVSFYKAQQYRVIPNYGKYVGNNLAICFEKKL
jgi:GNAT superfamily N-acetyltransferase